MSYDGDESPETDKRFFGTIVGVEDISSYWLNSKWRSLKVQWDESASIPRPDRVSPWEIKPKIKPHLASILASLAQPGVVKYKRPRPPSEVPNLGEEEEYPRTPSNSHSDSLRGARQHIFYKLRRFEKLAELDLVELEKRLLAQKVDEDETFMEEDDCEDEDI